jgi:TctA family transporter
MIAYEKWSKWKVIVYKVAVLGCGLIFFYVGVDYMNGAYKLTMGYFPTIEAIIKNMVYLYVFGNTELFFMMYRKLSSFDQTEELKYVYQFQDH